MGFFELFAETQTQTPKGNKPKPQTNTSGNTPNPFGQTSQIPLSQVKQFRTFFQGMLDQLEQKDIRITVIDLHNSSAHKAVAFLFTEYLRDKSMTELQNKEYKLLGKVVGKMSGANEMP